MRSFHSNVRASFGPSSEKPSKMTEKGPQSYESGGRFIEDVKTVKTISRVELEGSYEAEKSQHTELSVKENIYTPNLKQKNRLSHKNSSGNSGSYDAPQAARGNRGSL